MNCLFLTTSILLAFLSLTVAHNDDEDRNSRSCSAIARNLDSCIEKILDSDEAKNLRSRHKDIVSSCVHEKNLKTCPIENLIECGAQAKDDDDVQSAKETLFSAIDSCLSQNPPNVLSVLSHLQKGLQGGPLLEEARNELSCKAQPQAIASTASSIATNILGSNALNQFLQGGGPSQFLSQLNSPALSDLSSAFTSLIQKFSGGKRKRRDTVDGGEKDILNSQCPGLLNCVIKNEISSSDDVEILKLARKVFSDNMHCLKKNMPTLDCIPTTPDQVRCLEDAISAFGNATTTFMKGCMASANAGTN